MLQGAAVSPVAPMLEQLRSRSNMRRLLVGSLRIRCMSPSGQGLPLLGHPQAQARGQEQKLLRRSRCMRSMLVLLVRPMMRA